MAVEAVLAAALVWLLGVAFFQSRKTKPPPHASDPSEPFYHPFTTAFDRACSGDEMAALLTDEGLNTRPRLVATATDPADRRKEFDASYTAAKVAGVEAHSLGGTAVCVLVDQSGSMAECMPRVAGELLSVLEALEAAGAQTMLAGFTTMGWQGGRSRQKWIAEGRPAYPGRLCDLLHVTYSPFSVAVGDAQLAPLLQRAIFFENVDGEAIIWAEEQLRTQPAERRCLIVVSDGVPVDDSTLSANGPNFLWNHLVQTIAEVRARGGIALGAVGIDHRVDSLYPAARVVLAEHGLAAAIVAVVAELLPPRG